jgi:DNA-binding NtrC family response regulator
MLKVLVVDDDSGLRLSVKSALAVTKRFEVDEAFDGVNALEKVKSSPQNYDLVILDVDMPRMNGLEALRQIKEFNPGIIVIIMTAHATLTDAIQAVKDGAYNYLAKPVASEELLNLIDKAVNAHNLIANIAASAPVMVEEGRKIIGHTSQMQKVFNIIHRVAKVDTPVLIRGASGTGKELVAKAIHFNSARKDEKFVAINCSAIPENLFESELFGHEKGAFTGADQRKIGKFQFSEGGTLFLDEIGDMPQQMQVKILRVLQEKTFTPVGSNREFPANVRIVAATNRPLEEMIKAGTFREDLFYRLNVVPIFLPSLAERKEDMEHMVHIFMKKFNQSHAHRINGITPDAMSVLKKRSWPGNIRELENVIEHAFVLETTNIITLVSLPESLLVATGTNLIEVAHAGLSMAANNPMNLLNQHDPVKESSTSSLDIVEAEDLNNFENLDIDVENGDDEILGAPIQSAALDFNVQKEAFEKEFIIKALKTFRGRINQTALHANIPKKTLLRKIEKYGIVAKDYSVQ